MALNLVTGQIREISMQVGAVNALEFSGQIAAAPLQVQPLKVSIPLDKIRIREIVFISEQAVDIDVFFLDSANELLNLPLTHGLKGAVSMSGPLRCPWETLAGSAVYVMHENTDVAVSVPVAEDDPLLPVTIHRVMLTFGIVIFNRGAVAITDSRLIVKYELIS